MGTETFPFETAVLALKKNVTEMSALGCRYANRCLCSAPQTPSAKQ